MRLLLAFTCTLVLLGASLHAQVPQLVNYQGRVVVGTTNFNSPPNGLFKFALVNAAGTTTYWRNSPDTTPADGVPDLSVALTVTKGLYSVLLGDTSITNMAAIPASVWANPDVRLRVWFNDGTNGNQLLTPDQRLAPYGYLPDGSVSTAAIASGAITSTKIATGAVTNAQLATNAVLAANIAAGAVGSPQIGAGAVGLANIAAGAVGSTQIANTSVTAAKLASDVGLWSVTGAHVFRSSGNVGIGNNQFTPTSKLHINLSLPDTVPGLRVQLQGNSKFTVATNGGTSIGAFNDTPPANGLFVQGSVGIGTLNPINSLGYPGSYNGFHSYTSGNGLGIIEGNTARLHLRADGNTANTTQDFVIDNVANQINFWWLGAGLGGRLNVMTINSSGTVAVKVLQINGADVAEPFDMAVKDVPKGSVVVIDEENPGQLKVSDRAYNRRVAGILSGANGVRSGIRLSQEGFNEGGQDVALSGRVYVQADASNGAIHPGDLLTTSDTPGHAMKASDHARAQGAIIGKSMSRLNEGTGLVLVLVTLQ